MKLRNFPCLLVSALLIDSRAQGVEAIAPEGEITLPELVITGKAEDLLREAATASKGQASSVEIESRPYLRRGEILEIVPGMVVTQHAGGGKANQYFLRGFNLDHGTDFAISIDDMPLNMRTHAHGQGYADLNFIIPELIERVAYEKGVYSARNGDLSSAGSAEFKLVDVLPSGLASVSLGENGYWRGLIADTMEGPDGGLLTFALEGNRNEGPWTLPEDFSRWNGFARYVLGDDDHHVSVAFMSSSTDWRSSDQIPERAIEDGRIPLFGHIDPTTGGESQRHSLGVNFRSNDGRDVWRGNLYGLFYELDVFSNFTYFLENPLQGDQFEQAEQRSVIGGQLVREWLDRSILGCPSDHALGLQLRQDFIDPIGLYKTTNRHRYRTVREDEVSEGSLGIFGESTTRWREGFRTIAGLRGDLFHFDVSSNDPRNSGDETAGIISPKLSAVWGPWHQTEYYLNFGTGFHSNDARGVNNSVDPETNAPLSPVDPLVRTIGSEIGMRSQIFSKLTLTAALWWLDSDSELVYVGDAGTNEAGNASRRYGIETAAYWRPVDWLTLDGEIAITHARFRGVGDDSRIPGSVPCMISGGIRAGGVEGFFAGIRTRAFSPRPLTEDNSVKGKSSFLVNLQTGYRSKHWEIQLECLNLFDRDDNDIEYFYTSRLPGESAAGIDDTHLHPMEPRTLRMQATYRF